METAKPTSSATTAETEPAVIAAIDSGPGRPPERSNGRGRTGECPLSPGTRLLVGAAGIGIGYAIYHLTTRRQS
jgi:hypothetical protein